MKDQSKSLVALVAGFAAGAVVGLLFAPDKGSETRDKLSDSLKNLGDTIREKAAEEIDNLSVLKDKVVSNIKSKISQTDNEIVEDTELGNYNQ